MEKSLGFWRSWALVVGTMIGSGIFLLPSVLASFGAISLLGWVLTALGTLLIALTLGSLSAQIDKEGGPYAYCYEAIGPLAGFMIGWGLWISFWVSIAATSVAFAGYASTLFPAIEHSGIARTATSLLMVWTLATIFFFGIRGVGITQLLTTALKLIPLLLIPSLGFLVGEQSLDNMLSVEVSDNFWQSIAKVILITMWAFLGIEVATIPAKETINPKKTIPRALFYGLLSVAFVYLFATIGLWKLLPIDTLSASPSPFADAAEIVFGPIGGVLVSVGIMISIIGSANGCLLGTVVLPQSMASDGIFPSVFTDKNRHGVAWKSLLIAVVLITGVLLLNTSSRLVSAYEILIVLSTLTAILPYAVSAIADLLLQLKRKGTQPNQYNDKGKENEASNAPKPLSILSMLRAIGALVFSVCMILGAGMEVILYGVILLLAGVPLFMHFKTTSKAASKAMATENA
ncbi:APC family permease [Colwellia sp. MEBiC06753]